MDCASLIAGVVKELVKRNAEYVPGLDLCEAMIDAARALESGPDEYAKRPHDSPCRCGTCFNFSPYNHSL